MAARTPRTRPRRRSARSGALPFFQLRPTLLDPLVDGFVVAFSGSACWSLPTPLQTLAQDVPDMRRVIRHASYVVDHLGHTLQGPHVIRIAVGLSAFDQLAFDLRELVSGQFRQPSRSSSRTQSVSTRSTPRRAPIRDDLMPHAQLPCDLRRTDALFEQVRGAHPPLFHRLEVAPRPNAPHRRPAVPIQLYRNDPYPSVSHEPT